MEGRLLDKLQPPACICTWRHGLDSMKPPGHDDIIRSRDGRGRHKHDRYVRVDIKRQVENNSILNILWGQRG